MGTVARKPCVTSVSTFFINRFDAIVTRNVIYYVTYIIEALHRCRMHLVSSICLHAAIEPLQRTRMIKIC